VEREGGATGREGDRGKKGERRKRGNRTNDLLLAVKVDDLVFDTGSLTGKEKVEKGVDKVLEGALAVDADIGEDGTLGSACFG
jgi:hypothetical protein